LFGQDGTGAEECTVLRPEAGEEIYTNRQLLIRQTVGFTLGTEIVGPDKIVRPQQAMEAYQNALKRDPDRSNMAAWTGI